MPRAPTPAPFHQYIHHSTTTITRVVQFGVRSKIWVRELSRILTNPKNAVRWLLKIRQTLYPIFELLGLNLQPKRQKIALDGRQTLRYFLHSFIKIYNIHVEQYKHVLDV
jgi:hypothetical protein